MKSRRLSDVLLDLIVYSSLIFAVIITLYPFLYVFSMSISDPEAITRGEVILFPKGFSLTAFSKVLADKTIWRSYLNSIWYTVVGTFLNLIFTVLAAYPLSRKKFFARNFFTFLFILTMFFQGGMIPRFIVLVKLGLYNSRWAMVLPVLINTWNLIICRTFFQSLPEELFENARLEGGGEWRILWAIVLPLSTSILAVLTLYYGVYHWNSFFPALLYLSDSKLHPIQLYLRKILIMASAEATNTFDTGAAEDFLSILHIRYAVLIVTILPIIALYPFLQKYFIKGVMIGALKE